MGGDRLATRLSDVGDVVQRRQPGAVPVGPDALADDGEDVRRLSRTHQRGEPSRHDPVVGVMERDPLPACDLQSPVAGVRDPAVEGQSEQDDAWVAFRDGRDHVGRPIGESIVDDDALE